MATEEMNVNERLKYLCVVRERYVQADRATKSAILTAMQADTNLHRKYLIARMNGPAIQRRKRKRERSRSYGPDVEQTISLVADALDWIGAERLQPCLAETAQHLARFGHLTLTTALLGQLETIRISTVRRILHRLGRPPDALPQVRRGRRADSVVQSLVPIGVIPWQEPEPGHVEADLV